MAHIPERNLILVHTNLWQDRRDFEVIKAHVESMAPDIAVFIVENELSVHRVGENFMLADFSSCVAPGRKNGGNVGSVGYGQVVEPLSPVDHAGDVIGNNP